MIKLQIKGCKELAKGRVKDYKGIITLRKMTVKQLMSFLAGYGVIVTDCKEVK